MKNHLVDVDLVVLVQSVKKIAEQLDYPLQCVFVLSVPVTRHIGGNRVG